MKRLFSRRDSIVAMTLSTGAALVPARAQSGAPAIGPGSDELRTYLRIRSRLDGLPVFYPYRGTIFGRTIGQSATPLFDVEGFSWGRVSVIGKGHYRIDTAEAGYFLDLSSGEPLTNWLNPLNGLQTLVKNYRSFSHVLVSEGQIESILGATTLPGAHVAATMKPATVIGDRIWVHEDIIASFPNKPAASFADPREYNGPMLEAASLATWCAGLHDLADPDRAFVPAALSYQTVGSWRPFMRMGNTPGVISWRMFGTKAPNLDQVPPRLRARVLRDYPDFLTRIA